MKAKGCRRRCVRVTLLASLALTPPGAAQAQACAPGSISVYVDGKTLRLDQAVVTRVPYGRDMTAWIAPPEGALTKEVVVEYRVSSEERGVRTDAVPARLDSSRGCWAAGLEPLHLNETGVLTARLYLEPRYREAASPTTLLADLLVRLDALAGGHGFAERARRAVAASAAAALVDPGGVVVVEGETPALVLLVDRLATLALTEIEVTAALTAARSDARAVQDAVAMLIAGGTAAPGRVDTCPVATSLEGLRAAADALVAEPPERMGARVVDDHLPWPACALELVRSTTPATPIDSFHLATLEERTESLVRAPRLARLAGVVAAAREVLELAVSLETLSVPFGAGILERYTQVDLVSAYLWDAGITQEFAAATWYVFSPGGSYDFSAGVSPGAGLNAADRYGLQIGYPVGAPVTEPSDGVVFEPELLVGGMARINGILSLSAGVVIGREGGERTTPGYASLNLDLSNLGPLQKLFARRDPD